MKYLIIFSLVTLIPLIDYEGKLANSVGTPADSISIRKDFLQYFHNCRVQGSIVIYDYSSKKWILSDSNEVKKESLPASSFKIINLLIALEANVIKNEKEVVKWSGNVPDTLLYGFRPDVYHDMTVEEAFQQSAGWVFIELAKKIGKEKYLYYLKQSDYGNLDLSQSGDDFWNFGPFGISPINQVVFLKNVYEGKSMFSQRNVEILKRVMITEKSKKYTIRAKTGWTRDSGINTGWWVGYIEPKKGVFFFATRLFQDRKFNREDFGACRKIITKAILREIKALPEEKTGK